MAKTEKEAKTESPVKNETVTDIEKRKSLGSKKSSKANLSDRTCPNVTLPPSKRLGIDELFDSSGKPRPPILREHLRKEGRLTNE